MGLECQISTLGLGDRLGGPQGAAVGESLLKPQRHFSGTLCPLAHSPYCRADGTQTRAWAEWAIGMGKAGQGKQRSSGLLPLGVPERQTGQKGLERKTGLDLMKLVPQKGQTEPAGRVWWWWGQSCLEGLGSACVRAGSWGAGSDLGPLLCP